MKPLLHSRWHASCQKWQESNTVLLPKAALNWQLILLLRYNNSKAKGHIFFQELPKGIKLPWPTCILCSLLVASPSHSPLVFYEITSQISTCIQTLCQGLPLGNSNLDNAFHQSQPTFSLRGQVVNISALQVGYLYHRYSTLLLSSIL